LTVGEPDKIEPHHLRWFSFAASIAIFSHEEGLDMLLLNSRDAKADAAAFGSAGIGDFEVF